MLYSIGEFSKITNHTIHTLRYYEKENIITPLRNKVNKRRYTEKDIVWIRFVKRLKDTNMPIKEIKKYSLLREQGDSTLNERMDTLIKHRTKLISEIEAIKSNLTKLESKIEFYKNEIEKQYV